MGKKKDKDLPEQTVVGGPFFFLSLICLLIVGLLAPIAASTLISTAAFVHLGLFFCGGVIGAAIGHFLIRGHISVFLHELKHSILSNFAGNRARGMKINKESGHFEYEYTKDSARFNAFISLAPYWVPLFWAPTLIVCYLFWSGQHPTMVAIVGLAYGVDLVLNLRDISPHQTDLTLIRGGYLVGILYIAAMNFTLSSILFSWVMGGPQGVVQIIKALWLLVVGLFSIIHPVHS